MSLLLRQLFDAPLTGIDDADIFFVYARHFAEGNGFVYNLGSERVEGFSSLLWTLICAAGFAITPTPERLLFGINVSLMALTVFIGLRALLSSGPPSQGRSLGALFFGLALLSTPGFVHWMTLALMENALWTLLLLSGTLLATLSPLGTRSRIALAIVVTALVPTRPEAMLWAPLFAVAVA